MKWRRDIDEERLEEDEERPTSAQLSNSIVKKFENTNIEVSICNDFLRKNQWGAKN